MNLKQQLHTTQIQQLSLTPQMLQSLSILQMDSLSLYDYLMKKSTENPVIDLDLLERAERKRHASSSHSQDAAAHLGWIPAPESVLDDLKLQLSVKAPTEHLRKIGFYLIESLTPKGYLPREILAEAAACGMEETQILQAAALLQQLEPAGIGAFDLRHCLLLQLERKQKANQASCLIVSDHLALLGRNQLPVIAKKTGLSLQQVMLAAAEIKKLSPYPLNGAGGERTRYIVPDAYILREGDALRLQLNVITARDLRILPEYETLLHSSSDPAANNYLTSCMEQAAQIRKCLDQRNETLVRCIQTLFLVQSSFFLHGAAHLVPYSRQALAETLHLHESTVCRALQHTYLACEWGVFPAEYFFPQAVSDQNEGILRQEVLLAILRLLKQENPQHPLSDQKIAVLLKADGISVSRRTVAKYREQENIPNSALRRLVPPPSELD